MSNEPASLWSYKPWWCQPWSILLTGLVLVLATAELIRNLWLTLGVTGVIGLWWFYFLIYVPRWFRDQYVVDGLPENGVDEAD